MVDYITIIGGGLAGSEAAYQIAKRGIKVKLYEMKPDKFTEAHSNKNLAEIVCSNSFKSNLHTNACGLLKEELRKLFPLARAGNTKVRNYIIEKNTRLVIYYISRRYHKTESIDINELVSIGMLSLILATENFDVSKNNTFASYAIAAIENNINKYLNKENKQVDEGIPFIMRLFLVLLLIISLILISYFVYLFWRKYYVVSNTNLVR